MNKYVIYAGMVLAAGLLGINAYLILTSPERKLARLEYLIKAYDECQRRHVLPAINNLRALESNRPLAPAPAPVGVSPATEAAFDRLWKASVDSGSGSAPQLEEDIATAEDEVRLARLRCEVQYRID